VNLDAWILLVNLIIVVTSLALKLNFFLHTHIRPFLYLRVGQILDFRWRYTHNSEIINNLLSLKDAKISSELLLAEAYLFNVITLRIN